MELGVVMMLYVEYLHYVMIRIFTYYLHNQHGVAEGDTSSPYRNRES